MRTKYECIQNIDIVEIDDEWIIMDTENFRVTKVTAMGAYILEEVREQKEIEAIIETIAANYDVDGNIVRADALDFLEELKGIGILKDERTAISNS
ncbi:PqqD family protein [Bacillus songklensis]|uniref:PqqD family protein n=1 Tax=Bacillus songklensis TaxID=1069116 RepID=A0ABV8B3P3_9BACI